MRLQMRGISAMAMSESHKIACELVRRSQRSSPPVEEPEAPERWEQMRRVAEFP